MHNQHLNPQITTGQNQNTSGAWERKSQRERISHGERSSNKENEKERNERDNK